MALNGVNLPLAYTGQEKIYQKVREEELPIHARERSQ
jgi:hypothetical protein